MTPSTKKLSTLLAASCLVPLVGFGCAVDEGANESSDESADEGPMHEVLFYRDGSDQGVAVADYDVETKQLSIRANWDSELSAVVLDSQEREILFENEAEAFVMDDVELAVGSSHDAIGTIGALDSEDMQTIEGSLEVSADGKASSLEATATRCYQTSRNWCCNGTIFRYYCHVRRCNPGWRKSIKKNRAFGKTCLWNNPPN